MPLNILLNCHKLLDILEELFFQLYVELFGKGTAAYNKNVLKMYVYVYLKSTIFKRLAQENTVFRLKSYYNIQCVPEVRKRSVTINLS